MTASTTGGHGVPRPARRRAAVLGAVLSGLVAVTSCGDVPGAGAEAAGQRAARSASPPATSPESSSATSPATSPANSPAPGPGEQPGAPAPGAQATGPARSAPPAAGVQQDDRTTFTVVGDSITAGILALEGATVRGANSWIPAAQRNQRVDFVGGWAVPGATTTEMRAAVRPSSADVVVILGGTNDLAAATAWPQIEANLLQIAATAGAPSVLLSAVPPRDSAPRPTRELNEQLEQLALASGWTFVDPWADMASDGAWMAETTDDGIHPREDVAALVGDRLAAAIAAAG